MCVCVFCFVHQPAAALSLSLSLSLSLMLMRLLLLLLLRLLLVSSLDGVVACCLLSAAAGLARHQSQPRLTVRPSVRPLACLAAVTASESVSWSAETRAFKRRSLAREHTCGFQMSSRSSVISVAHSVGRSLWFSISESSLNVKLKSAQPGKSKH